MGVEPAFDPLRSDTRYELLLKKLDRSSYASNEG
jgi:hypothetical protein